MLRVVQTGIGGLDVYDVQTCPVPRPAIGEILIRTEFAGINYSDVLIRRGEYVATPKLPFTPGWDVVGTVAELGPSVNGHSGFSVGDRVVVLTQTGGYAQYVTANAIAATHVPEGVPSDKAVCCVSSYVAAHQLLHRIARVHGGWRILVHSAAGGVGTALTQLARIAGCAVYGTASAGKHGTVRSLGAVPIDYRSSDFVVEMSRSEPDGIDAVFDPIGGEHWLRSRRIIRRGGIVVGYGMRTIRTAARMLVASRGRRFSYYSMNPRNVRQNAEDVRLVLNLCSERIIDPVIGSRLPLERVRDAHRLLTDGAITGKALLDCR